MDEYLELLEAYEHQSNLSIEYLFEYTTEGVLSSIGEAIERAIVVVDQFAKNCKSLVENRLRYKKVKDIYNAWFRIYPKLSKKEREAYVIFRDYPLLTEQDADYMFKLIKNLDALFQLKMRASKDEQERELDRIRTEYMRNVKGTIYGTGLKGNSVYQANIEYLAHHCKEQMKKYDTEMAVLKRNLFSVKALCEETKDKTIQDIGIVGFFKKIHAAIKLKCICMLFNIESFVFAAKDATFRMIDKEASERIQNYQKLRDKGPEEYYAWVKKSAKFIKTMDIGGNIVFNIYQLPVKHISCFNLRGKDVYVDETFFDRPVCFQKSVLYHEFGHYMAGHFGVAELPDEQRLINQMRKDIEKFKRLVRNKQYVHDEEELIYLLVELEADRYAAKHTGGFTRKIGLLTNAKKFLHFAIPKDPAAITMQESLLIAYNKERMVLRNQML